MKRASRFLLLIAFLSSYSTRTTQWTCNKNSGGSILVTASELSSLSAAGRAAKARASSLLSRLRPISLRESLNKLIRRRWERAEELVRLESLCEDYNAEWIARAGRAKVACRHRRLIVMPLDEGVFNPAPGVFSHGHVQTGDKMSLPKNFGRAIELNKAEVPWLFSVSRVPNVTSDRVRFKSSSENENDCGDYGDKRNSIKWDNTYSPNQPLEELNTVVGGPLDFRAPSCYVFLPSWMMRSLGVKPRDIVQVELVTNTAAGSLAKFRPHTSAFVKNINNPRAVLETELRHYSALTAGSTIAFDYNDERFWFDVVELRSSGGVGGSATSEKVPAIKVQDCDIATDFLTSKEDLAARRKKMLEKKRKKLQEEEEEED